MGMRLPHTLTWTSKDEVLGGVNTQVVMHLTDSAPAGGLYGVTKRCQITPLSPAEAFDAWDVEVKRPHLCIMGVNDGGVKVGDTAIDQDGNNYIVEGAPMRWGAGIRANSSQILLNRVLS